MATDTHRAIDAVWRIESARLIAGLARMVHDVGLAAQDALVAALGQCPESGVPDNPVAWLMATAKHRAIDHFRRSVRLERKHEDLGRELEKKMPISSGGSLSLTRICPDKPVLGFLVFRTTVNASVENREHLSHPFTKR